jgi:hypothetical protein
MLLVHPDGVTEAVSVVISRPLLGRCRIANNSIDCGIETAWLLVFFRILPECPVKRPEIDAGFGSDTAAGGQVETDSVETALDA